MASWPVAITELLWQNALAAIPAVLIIAAVCKFVPCRPSTRHFLWLLVLVLFLVPRVVPPERITRLVVAVLPTGQASLPQPVQVARTHAEQPSDDPQQSRAKRALPYASSDGEAGGTKPVELKSQGQPEQIGQRGRRVTRQPERASRAKKSMPLLEEDACTETGHSRRARGNAMQSAVREPPSKRGATASKPGVAHRPTPPELRLDAEISIPHAVVAGGNGITRIENGTPTPGKGATRTSKSPAAGRLGEVQAMSPRASRAGASEPSPPSIWEQSLHQLQTQWVLGMNKLVELRSLVLGLPPVPISLWLGGVVTLLFLSLRRMHRFQRVLRRAIPAGAAINAEVAKAATEMGVRRPPTTMMVQRRISPMILCGPRPKLILPVQLWSDLDGVSRRAVLCHELAHLRRRDHVVTWIEWIVGLIYWWNPLVWWVRHRLHEEAELSCDQWVTWLLPRDRRAYAVALLRAKEYVGRSHVVAPAMSMGATTQTTRKLARRIKMVMTATSRPRLSVIGTALACALVTTAWMSGAAWACPPKAKKAKAAEKCCASCKEKCDGDCSGSKCKGKCCGSCTAKGKSAFSVTRPAPRDRRDTSDEELSTFERHMSEGKAAKARKAPKAPKAKRGKKGDGRTSRMDGAGRVWSRATGTTPFYTIVSGDADESDVERFEERMRRLEERIERFTERMERQLERQLQRRPQAWTVPALPKTPETFFMPGDDVGEKTWRTYRLSKGKLDRLTELMVRSDVPIYVRPHDDHIEVQGTASEHRIFKAFVDMINPPTNADAREAIRQENLATDALAQRVQMESGARAMEVRARMLEQRAEQFAQRADELQMRAEELQSAAESLQDRLKTRALEQASSLIDEAQALQDQAAASAQEAEELEGKSEEFQERAAELREFLDVLQDQAKRAAEQAWWAPEVITEDELADAAESVQPEAPMPDLPELGPEPVITAPLPPAVDIAPEPSDANPIR